MTADIESMAGEAPTGYSSGGMVTKLAAARIAMSAGCRMAIADGRRMNPLQAILDNPRGYYVNLHTSVNQTGALREQMHNPKKR